MTNTSAKMKAKSETAVNVIKMFDDAVTLTSLIAYVNQHPYIIQTNLSDLNLTLDYDENRNELVCGCKSVDGKVDELRLCENDNIEDLVNYVFSRSIVHYGNGASSGLSEMSIYAFLSLLLDGVYPTTEGEKR